MQGHQAFYPAQFPGGYTMHSQLRSFGSVPHLPTYSDQHITAAAAQVSIHNMRPCPLLGQMWRTGITLAVHNSLLKELSKKKSKPPGLATHTKVLRIPLGDNDLVTVLGHFGEG